MADRAVLVGAGRPWQPHLGRKAVAAKSRPLVRSGMSSVQTVRVRVAYPALLLVFLALACRPGGAPTGSAEADEPGGGSQKATPAATVDAAQKFIDEFEPAYLDLLMRRERADWLRATHITHDTELLAAQTEVALMEFAAQKARESQRFLGLALDGELARKMNLVRVSQTVPGPNDAARREELAAVTTRMQSHYGKGKYCPEGAAGTCYTLGDLSKRLAESRKPEVLLDAWTGWRSVSASMRTDYMRFVELANEGARDMGFTDLGALWRANYDMKPEEFAQEVDRLWNQVRPLYEQLHCYVRNRLATHYGPAVLADEGPIPAHLLGNMWAQDWGYLNWLAMPKRTRAGNTSEITAALRAKNVDARGMVGYAERFFVSLGLPKLPETFWQRSMFTRPRDREVQCHASAWNLDWREDLRIKMCIQTNAEDFTVIHHELGHNYYYWAYNDQSVLFANSAHDGFHEALGDTIALSVTPSYLKQVGLVANPTQDDLIVLMQRALDRVSFLPFGLVVDKWRWQVFSGQIAPEQYNAAWWQLRREYQGIRPPVERTEAQFDPGAKFHVAANVPYTRYFLAHILQFQLHRALCKVAGHQGPLHTCSIYGSKAAGEKLQAMMKLGSSQPWPDALEVATGERQMDATALLEYFAPLYEWLQAQNQQRTCGW